MLLGRQTHIMKAEAYFLQKRREAAIRRSKKLKRRKANSKPALKRRPNLNRRCGD
jgi:hypothetical protein